MALFAFEAVEPGGLVVRGTLDADSHSIAVEHLLTTGHTPLSLVQAGSKGRLVAAARSRLRFAGDELTTFAREMSSLLSAGLTVERSLRIVRDLAANRDASLRVGQVLERVRSGEPFSAALRILLPGAAQHIEHLVAAGEASGQLAPVMARLSGNLQRAKVLRDRIVSSLTYPAFLVLTLVAVLWVVFVSVLPRLAPLFSQARAVLPLATRIMLGISEFIRGYGWFILVALALLAVGTIYAWSVPAVRKTLHRVLLTSRLFLRVPVEYEAARFCRNLETLLGGGMALDRALAASRSAAMNIWFREQLAALQEFVESGSSLKTAFQRCQVMPPLVVEFAAVGEETGQLAAMMRQCAEVLERDVEVRLDRLTALLLPAATLVMGLIVAGVMASVVIGLLAINDLAR